MSSRCAVDLFGRLHINFAGCGLPVADVAQQQHRPRRQPRRGLPVADVAQQQHRPRRLGTVPDGSRDYTDVCQEILGNMTVRVSSGDLDEVEAPTEPADETILSYFKGVECNMPKRCKQDECSVRRT